MMLATEESSALPIRVQVATTLFLRMRGLLGRPAPGPREGLLIPRCSSIHTIGMTYPIDVVFLDRFMTVIRIVPRVRPGRLAIVARGSSSVLELAGGAAGSLRIRVGQKFTNQT